MQRSIFLTLSLFGAALFTGCRGILNFSPEMAVQQSLMEHPPFNSTIQPDTLAVLQTVDFEGSKFVLARFNTLDGNGQVSECTQMYETIRRAGSWFTGSGGGGCGPAGANQNPIGVGTGSSINNERAYSSANGLVYQEDFQAIEVIWDDGETQRVEVINGSYMVLRSGIHQVAFIHAYNEFEEAIYTYERPEPAPGKEGG